MPVKLANNAIGRLAINISATDAAITLQAGQGSSFPTLTAGQWFPVTIARADATVEIVRVTARAGDVLTVTRGQEGTQPTSFSTGDRVELRMTVGTLAELLSEIMASGISISAIPGMTATNVQAALAELKSAPAVTWANISGKPATFPPVIGTTSTTAKAGDYAPTWEQVTGKPAIDANGTANTIAQRDTAGDLRARLFRSSYASTNGSITHIYTGTGTIGADFIRPSTPAQVKASLGIVWGDVGGKPSTFAPSSHTHAWSQITGAPAQATRWPTWGEVTGKPTTFTPSQPTAAQIGAATAGLAYAARGSYLAGQWQGTNLGSAPQVGSTYANTSFNDTTPALPSGTYRAMGIANTITNASGNLTRYTRTYIVLRVT